MMELHWKYFLFLVWISYLLVSGVLFFCRGFLLNRKSQPDKTFCKLSNCRDSVRHSEYVNTEQALNKSESVSRQCDQIDSDLWKSLGHNDNIVLPCLSSDTKVLLIVIDALKYDFADFDIHLQESDLHPYQNKLTVIHDLLTSQPSHSKLYKFIADPPTTTMQRLKGLTTGSLPTFIDLGSNFATPEINEDNFLDQLIDQNKSIVFMGDDTWAGLYPNRFVREYSFPSFNVWDLDSVDYGIMKNLVPEIGKGDWSLLIAHFLGVDHCGHRYGPFHSEMSRKLIEMNSMITKVIEAMDDNTVLIVVGDHGMTASGDHGGDSDSEITAAMFVHSHRPLNSGVPNEEPIVSQVDLVPTVAALLGLPMPFSNLGAVVLDALPRTTWPNLLEIVWLNVRQVTHYVRQYAEHSRLFSHEQITTVTERYDTLWAKVAQVKDTNGFVEFAALAKSHVTELKGMCAQVWVQFDADAMFQGLLVTFITLFIVFVLIAGIPGEVLRERLGNILAAGYGGVLLSGIASVLTASAGLVDSLELTFYFTSGMISIVVLSSVVVKHWVSIAEKFHQQQQASDWTGLAARLILIFSLAGTFSNSYVIEEAAVSSFFLLSLVWLLVLSFKSVKESFATKTKEVETQTASWFKLKSNETRWTLVGLAIAFSILIRMSRYYWKCREEQPGCMSRVSTKSPSGRYRQAECLLTLVCIALLVTAVRIWLRTRGNLVGWSATQLLARYAPSVLVVCTGGYWIAQCLTKVAKTKLFLPWQLQYLPWVVYIVAAITFISLLIDPLCVYIMPRHGNLSAMHLQGNKIPALFREAKRALGSSGHEGPMPMVYGLATVYSAAFIVLCLFALLLFALVLGDVLAPAAVVMFAAGGVLIAVLAIVRLDSVLLAGQLFHVPWFSVICWTLFSSYFFYGTGHQPAFPAIHWEAAFVGSGGQIGSHVLPAVLVTINTFGAQVVAALALPLLLIAPLTITSAWPALANDDTRRGEMALFERRSLLDAGLFALCAKFVLVLGLKMFACMLAATVHCRHLMVWKIFAPRLMFEGLALLVTLPAVLLAFLLAARVSAKVEGLLARLSDGVS